MLCAQIIQRCIAANLKIGMEVNARILQPLDTAHDNVFFQLETGDAIGHQPAHAVIAVIYMDVIARDAQIFCGRQPAGASADDANRLAARWANIDGFNPALLPRGIGDVFFNRANGDRVMARKFNNAITLAQAILRANAAADFRHSAGQAGHLIGFAQTPFGRQA